MALGWLSLAQGALTAAGDFANSWANQQALQAQGDQFLGPDGIYAQNQAGLQAGFGSLQNYLSPYTTAGTQATNQMAALSGAAGADAQQAAIAGIASGPQLQAMMEQGEAAILQNAAATGGLRGGNTQGALAQYRPQMVQQAIQQQMQNLGGLSQMGMSAGSQLGAAEMNLASQLGNLRAAEGQLQGQLDSWNPWLAAGSALASGLGSGLGTYMGGGGTFGAGGGAKVR